VWDLKKKKRREVCVEFKQGLKTLLGLKQLETQATSILLFYTQKHHTKAVDTLDYTFDTFDTLTSAKLLRKREATLLLKPHIQFKE
jgi:hypothetical protein